MRYLSTFLAAVLAMPAAPLAAQDTAPKLFLAIVEGDGAINNIRQRTAREPIVQVEDENHRPVAGAIVVFTLPARGAGGTFPNGATTLTTTTDAKGQAVARGLRPNNVQGNYEIRVNASSNGRTASTSISQTNAVVAGVAGAAAGLSATKLIAIIAAAAGAAVAGGYYAATHTGNNGATPAPPSVITITPGTGTVGPPR
jgi:hypothetical protein